MEEIEVMSPVFGYNSDSYVFPVIFNISSYVPFALLAGVFKVTTTVKFLPYLAIISGLTRLISASIGIIQQKSEENKQILKGHVWRGLGEIFQLGPIFLICDIAKTVLYCRNKPE